MNVLQIVLSICTIGMFILSLVLIRVVFKRFRQVFRKKSIRPSSIDKMLFYERNPFAWRIGFAYSLLGYNQEQIDQFNDALIKIIRAEKNMYQISRTNYFGKFKNFINRIEPKTEIVSQIMEYRNHLSSSSILNETNPENELEFVLSLEVDKFLNETTRSIRQSLIERMEEPGEEPPF